MKKLFVILILFVFVLSANNANAQESADNTIGNPAVESSTKNRSFEIEIMMKQGKLAFFSPDEKSVSKIINNTSKIKENFRIIFLFKKKDEGYKWIISENEKKTYEIDSNNNYEIISIKEVIFF